MILQCQKCGIEIGEAADLKSVGINGILGVFRPFDALFFCTPCADIIEKACDLTKDPVPHWGKYPSPMDGPHEQIFTTKKEPVDDIFNQFLKENGLL